MKSEIKCYVGDQLVYHGPLDLNLWRGRSFSKIEIIEWVKEEEARKYE